MSMQLLLFLHRCISFSYSIGSFTFNFKFAKINKASTFSALRQFLRFAYIIRIFILSLFIAFYLWIYLQPKMKDEDCD